MCREAATCLERFCGSGKILLAQMADGQKFPIVPSSWSGSTGFAKNAWAPRAIAFSRSVLVGCPVMKTSFPRHDLRPSSS